ncbi:MAG: N-acetyltransferase [Chloroflexi bacterium]|nr:N-acetyltransferase [Chloroflexota bacterium]
MHTDVRIHPTADVSEQAQIGEGTSIWHQAQVREGTNLGRNCIVGKGSYIDAGVTLGDNVKVQNYVSVYHGVTLEDGVFCGPHCIFTNDKRPRAINADGSLKAADDWELSPTLVKKGAAIGANAVIVCGVTVGEWAMIGSGAVVSRDVPDHGLVWGNPARLHGFVCPCGRRLKNPGEDEGRAEEAQTIELECSECGAVIQISRANWEQIK